jgi:hypothetical protein
MADIAVARGEFSTASLFYRESLIAFQKGADQIGLPFALESVAALALRWKLTEFAALILGAADTLRESTHSPLPPSNQADDQVVRSALQEQLGLDSFHSALSQGRMMPVDQVISLALQMLESGQSDVHLS